jgi:hypothetical protein
MADAFDAKNTWFGVGGKIGGVMIGAGFESTTGYLFNLENPAFNAPFTIENVRLGPGLGGSAGACVLIILNCRSVLTLHNSDVTDWGLNVALGAKLDGLVKLLRGAKEFDLLWPVARQALRVVGQMRGGTVQMAKKVAPALKGMGLTPDDFDKIKTAVNYAWNAKNTLDRDSKPFILALDIPGVGYGLEVSLVYTQGKFSLL